MQRNDIVGRLLGIVTFLAGVGLLVFVFSLANSFFHTDLLAQSSGGSTEPVAAQLGKSAVGILCKIGLLVVMTLVGSLVAGRGIQLYFASAGRRKPLEEPAKELTE